MNPREKSIKIIWAIDPFAEDKSYQRTALEAIRSIFEGVQVEIEPVYAMSDYPVTGMFASVKGLRESATSAAQVELTGLLDGSDTPALGRVTVLNEAGINLKETVEGLVSYAKKTEAQLIVASTRARQGPRRWVNGSFVETLMSCSEVPLLVVSPLWNQKLKLKHIIFPTDFSTESETVFAGMLKLARALSCRVTLQHRLDCDRGAEKRWIELARAAGVVAEPFIEYGTHGSLSESILWLADREPGLIAMTVQGGSVSTLLSDSAARRIMRKAHSPVWIHRTEAV